MWGKGQQENIKEWVLREGVLCGCYVRGKGQDQGQSRNTCQTPPFNSHLPTFLLCLPSRICQNSGVSSFLLYLEHDDDDDDDDDDVHQRESVSELRQMCKGFAHLNVNWVSLAMTFLSVCFPTECHDYYFEGKSQLCIQTFWVQTFLF